MKERDRKQGGDPHVHAKGRRMNAAEEGYKFSTPLARPTRRPFLWGFVKSQYYLKCMPTLGKIDTDVARL